MIIETTFDINDKVYSISQERRKEWVVCPACAGEGRVMLKDNQYRLCPECYGNKGKYIYLEMAWQVLKTLTIGHVRAEISNITPDEFNNMGHFEEGKTVQRNEYMAYETGIGSGTLWEEDILFRSLEEAQKECDRRNKGAECKK